MVTGALFTLLFFVIGCYVRLLRVVVVGVLGFAYMVYLVVLSCVFVFVWCVWGLVV